MMCISGHPPFVPRQVNSVNCAGFALVVHLNGRVASFVCLPVQIIARTHDRPVEMQDTAAVLPCEALSSSEAAGLLGGWVLL